MRSLWACLGIVVLSVSLRTYCVTPWVVITNDSKYDVKVRDAQRKGYYLKPHERDSLDLWAGGVQWWKKDKKFVKTQHPETVILIYEFPYARRTSQYAIEKPGHQ